MRGEANGAGSNSNVRWNTEYKLFLIFAVLGPPIGFFSAIAPALLDCLLTKDKCIRVNHFMYLPIFIMLSYIFGLFQSIIAGISAVIVSRNDIKMPLLTMILISIILSIANFLFLHLYLFPKNDNAFIANAVLFIYLAYIHLAATFGCWLIARWLRLPPIEGKQAS